MPIAAATSNALKLKGKGLKDKSAKEGKMISVKMLDRSISLCSRNFVYMTVLYLWLFNISHTPEALTL